ncbi:MAG: M23 family metallopeptidase [Candidatus Gracilibacteria bacterium]|nr:M23 family metallopeptidase [Candidatus Gracilibacteria bacterium]
MTSKSILTGIIGVIIFSLVFGYTLVFAGTGIFDYNTKIEYKLSDNIYLDSAELNKTNILFKSGNNLSKYKIKSECKISSKITHKKGNSYMFDLKFLDNKCKNNNFVLVDEKNIIKLQFTINIISEYNILSVMLDLKDEQLSRFQASLNRKINSLSKFSSYDKSIEENYYIYLSNNRSLQEAIYNQGVVSNIISKRSQKYIVPVDGFKMPTNFSKMPNSPRGYRKDYTYGIHEGWDIDTRFGEQVIALDDGIIIRTISDFVFSDLNAIVKGNNLSDENLVKNLDILRGNQVWLKTMKGDVIMYSHLNELVSNIQVGEVVKKGQPLGTIGISGVPDEKYTDYHLHFEVHRNPFNLKKGESYDFDDYMRWDWLFKGKSYEYILENQLNYFEE